MGGILPDHEIVRRCREENMIEPFEDKAVRYIARTRSLSDIDAIVNDKERQEAKELYLRWSNGDNRVISYGVTSYGYDFRIADEFQIFHNAYGDVIDPKNFSPKAMLPFKGPVCRIPPNSFVLARTVEKFKIPRDIQTIVLGKSTYARCGIAITVTPFEPEWEGYATIEISNLTPLPALIYANEGMGQILFFRHDGVQPCRVSYKDKGGKYQGQPASIIAPRL